MELTFDLISNGTILLDGQWLSSLVIARDNGKSFDLSDSLLRQCDLGCVAMRMALQKDQ